MSNLFKTLSDSLVSELMKIQEEFPTHISAIIEIKRLRFEKILIEAKYTKSQRGAPKKLAVNPMLKPPPGPKNSGRPALYSEEDIKEINNLRDTIREQLAEKNGKNPTIRKIVEAYCSKDSKFASLRSDKKEKAIKAVISLFKYCAENRTKTRRKTLKKNK